MPTIGEILSEARRARKITIKEVESITNIRSRYIKALENNKFDVIPGHVYAKGFIRTYAEYLGIDYIPMIETYKKEYEEVYNRQKPEKPAALYHEKSRYGSFLIIVIIIFIVIATIFVIWNFGNRSVTEEKVPEIITETKKETDLKETTPSEKVQEEFKTDEGEEGTGLEQTEGPFTIEVEVVNERSYIEATVDDKVVFADVLEQGESKEWQGLKEIKIRTAHADSVKVIKNGEDVGFMGESSGVAERIFTETSEE